MFSISPYILNSESNCLFIMSLPNLGNLYFDRGVILGESMNENNIGLKNPILLIIVRNDFFECLKLLYLIHSFIINIIFLKSSYFISKYIYTFKNKYIF